MEKTTGGTLKKSTKAIKNSNLLFIVSRFGNI
jgi:hypothetical protein